MSRLQATREDAVTRSGARRMHTEATYFPDQCRVFAITRTWNAVKLTGFTGGVAVVFLDAQRRAIGRSRVLSFGVDGAWLGIYDRRESWEDAIDPSQPWVAQIAGIDVLHTHAGRNRLQDIIHQAVAAGKTIGELSSWLLGLKPAS